MQKAEDWKVKREEKAKARGLEKEKSKFASVTTDPIAERFLSELIDAIELYS